MNNLIALLKIKTFIQHQYENKSDQVYYNYDSHNEVEATENIENIHRIITTYKNTKVIYRILNVKKIIEKFKPLENEYPEYIIYDFNNTAKIQDKFYNYFDVCNLSLFYPTFLESFKSKIFILKSTDYVAYNTIITLNSDIKIKTTISDNDGLEFKLFYNPTYETGNNIYGYKYEIGDLNIIKQYDYRIRTVKDYKIKLDSNHSKGE